MLDLGCWMFDVGCSLLAVRPGSDLRLPLPCPALAEGEAGASPLKSGLAEKSQRDFGLKAQGCEERATLDIDGLNRSATLKGLWRCWTKDAGHNPFRVEGHDDWIVHPG